jgi:hypothetical protein
MLIMLQEGDFFGLIILKEIFEKINVKGDWD